MSPLNAVETVLVLLLCAAAVIGMGIALWRSDDRPVLETDAGNTYFGPPPAPEWQVTYTNVYRVPRVKRLRAERRR